DLVDREGGVREALDEGRGATRAQLFRRAIVGGGTFLAGGMLIGGLPKLALGAPSASQDVEILNFALLLEYLESEFYIEAVAKNAIGGETLAFATVVRDHELAHVAFLKSALGSKASAKPQFDFKDTTSDPDKFRATSIALEDTGVAAYNGQGPRLTKPTLAAAAQIVSVEARHAAWIRRITGKPSYGGQAANYPAPGVLDPGKTKKQIEDIVAATGFVKS
ncbi:MAG: ferritin-like domain-containing protein, partial [Solirubrobacteraceae bacterium]